MAHRLVILGAGGNAGDILDIVAAINSIGTRWEVTGLLDDAASRGAHRYGQRVIGPLSDVALFHSETFFVNAIGSQSSHRARANIVAATGLPDNRFATLVHPGAAVSGGASLEAGSYACFGVSVAQGVRIGRHVHLGAGAILGHDTMIDDFTLIAPAAVISGFVRIGRAAYIGANASVRQNTTIGHGALVGMGAVVLHDVPPNTTVAGNPARTLARSRGVANLSK